MFSPYRQELYKSFNYIDAKYLGIVASFFNWEMLFTAYQEGSVLLSSNWKWKSDCPKNRPVNGTHFEILVESNKAPLPLVYDQ